MEDKEFYIPCDDCEYYIAGCCSCGEETEKPCKSEASGAGLGLGTLYDINKQVIQQLPILSNKDLLEQVTNLSLSLHERYQYYMLLNKETSDYTLFNFAVKKQSCIEFRSDFIECLQNRGNVISIAPAIGEDAYEIWLKTHAYEGEEEQILCYYFFPYDIGVLEY